MKTSISPKSGKTLDCPSNRERDGWSKETLFREKLDSQVKETESLKRQIAKPKQQLVDSGTMYFSMHAKPADHMVHCQSSGSVGSSMIEEVVELRVKLKEAHAFNEELKASFQSNLNQLQLTIKECIEDREKILTKK